MKIGKFNNHLFYIGGVKKRIPNNRKKRSRRLYFLLFLSFFCECYLPKQGIGLFNLYRKAEDNARILQSTADSTLISFLTQVKSIKDFATDSLGLAIDKNYTRYIEIDKKYLVDVVSASLPDTFEQHSWWYPIIGDVPYKGYFDSTDAHIEAEKLRKAGLDVYCWKARAFSTLGFFTDPLLSYMKDYSAYQLASLLIHEQTHATLYLRGQSQFNEELATFIGREGALKYIAARYDTSSTVYHTAREFINDQKMFYQKIKTLYDTLHVVYQQDLSERELLDSKQTIISEYQKIFSTNYDSFFKTERFRGFSKIQINNAYLLAYNTYNKDLDLFYQIYSQHQHDLKKTISLLLKSKEHKNNPKEFLQKFIVPYSE